MGCAGTILKPPNAGLWNASGSSANLGILRPKRQIQTPTLASPDNALIFQWLAGKAVSLTKGVLYH
jgi:hypothetical protein